jgi:hypothetical protein
VTTRQVAPSPETPSRSRQQAPPASAPAPPASASARSGGPSAAQALALQRSAGNRATGRALARWAAHPDKDKKGALVPDAVAAEYLRFNPPKNQ